MLVIPIAVSPANRISVWVALQTFSVGASHSQALKKDAAVVALPVVRTQSSEVAGDTEIPVVARY